MSDQLYIPADGTIFIEIKGCCTRQQQSPLDANWLSALVTVTSSSISSKVDAFLSTYDLHRFRDDLKDGLCGKRREAALFSDENQVHINVAFGETDQCNVSGHLKEIGQAKVVTTFSFTIDRGSLFRVAENLDSILQKNPVIEL